MKFLKLTPAFLLIATIASAQITSALNPGVGENIGYMYVHADTLQPGLPGLEFYQFKVADSLSTSLGYVAPVSTPFDDSITDPSKNLSVQIGSGYSYYQTDASEWGVVGYASQNFGLTYDKHLPLFRYPMNNGTTFSDSASAVFFNSGIEVHRAATISAVVDADAFLAVQDAFQNPKDTGQCLRVHVIEEYNDDTYVNGVFYKTYKTTVDSYYWIHKTPNEILFSIQTISFDDLADPVNNTSRALSRYKQ